MVGLGTYLRISHPSKYCVTGKDEAPPISQTATAGKWVLSCGLVPSMIKLIELLSKEF